MRIIKRAFIFLLLLACIPCSTASDQLLNSLQPRGFVNDFANVISAAEEQQLNAMISEVQQKTGAQMAVVTLSSLDGGEIDDFTNRLYERWGVGQKGKDNGLMFLAAMQERKMRIEVGYGLEGAIPDSKAGHIRRNVITPFFKSGNPGRGIVAGIAALSQEIAQEYGVTITGAAARYQPGSRQTGTERKGNPLVTLIFMVIFAIFAIRHPHLALLLLLSSGRGGGGYRSGGGGFGGGGGGFGGGMSGGGGSSGGW